MLFYFSALDNEKIGDLGCIHHTAATNGDNHVALVLLCKARTLHHGFDGRIGGHIAVGADNLDVGPFEPFFYHFRRTRLEEDLIGHEDGPSFAERGHRMADVLQNAEPVNQFRGKRKFKIFRQHGISCHQCLTVR